MAPNQNGMIAKATNDESEGTSLVNRSERIIVSIKFGNDQRYEILRQPFVCQQKDRPNKNPYERKPGEKPYKLEIVWRNIIAFLYLHFAAVYAFTYSPKFSTVAIGKLEKHFYVT